MKKELHHSGSEAFYETVLKLQNVDECRGFFEDICSTHELRTIEQRFQLLYLLTCGSSYSAIEEETGASSATISRASRQLNGSHCNIAEIITRSITPKEERKCTL